MAQALSRLPALPEWHDAALLRREKWPAFRRGAARGAGAIARCRAERRRGAAGLRRAAGRPGGAGAGARPAARPARPQPDRRRQPARQGAGALRLHADRIADARRWRRSTPTSASDRRMLRLLQGDVGSGKTLVALLAMLRAVEAGKQAALMAPTEVLAKQHHRTLSRLSPGAGGAADRRGEGPRAGAAAARVEGRRRAAWSSARMRCSRRAWSTTTSALAVIDEQHRFGVDQRLLLGGKGEQTDVLVMTATPIPRTLLLTQWGEMDVSPPDREAARAAAGAHVAALAGHAAGRCWRRSRASWTRARRSTGCARWWRRARRSTWPRPRSGSPCCASGSASAVGLAHGQQDAAVRDAHAGRVRRAASAGCWWRRR